MMRFIIYVPVILTTIKLKGRDRWTM